MHWIIMTLIFFYPSWGRVEIKEHAKWVKATYGPSMGEYLKGYCRESIDEESGRACIDSRMPRR